MGMDLNEPLDLNAPLDLNGGDDYEEYDDGELEPEPEPEQAYSGTRDTCARTRICSCVYVYAFD